MHRAMRALEVVLTEIAVELPLIWLLSMFTSVLEAVWLKAIPVVFSAKKLSRILPRVPFCALKPVPHL